MAFVAGKAAFVEKQVFTVTYCLSLGQEMIWMSVYEFIFSEKAATRITRHVAFWVAFALHIFLFRYYVPDLKYLFYSSTYAIRLENLLLFLPVCFFYAYFAIYYLLPHYILKGRYSKLAVIILLLSILLVLLSYLLSTLFTIRLAFDMPLNRATLVRQIDFTVSNGLVYPLTVSGFAIGIKMGKNFYRQQQVNEQLAKQKINAEVQLLKGQIHPRFLFHSLANIYSDMLNGSEQSPNMILKLSDILSYILYESAEERVLLREELAMIQNFIDLEKISYTDGLLIRVENNIHNSNKLIAPLILLPVLECAFEQKSRHLQQPLQLALCMRMKENTFLFNLTMSGYQPAINSAPGENIQLLQVQKRLQLLYPKKHYFEIAIKESDIDIFMSILLDETAIHPVN